VRAVYYTDGVFDIWALKKGATRAVAIDESGKRSEPDDGGDGRDSASVTVRLLLTSEMIRKIMLRWFLSRRTAIAAASRSGKQLCGAQPKITSHESREVIA
jgi:hypothetical protein